MCPYTVSMASYSGKLLANCVVYSANRRHHAETIHTIIDSLKI